MPAPSRRIPWPTDIRIAGRGLVSGRPSQGLPLIDMTVEPYQEQVNPEDESQTSLPPLVELVHAWNDLSLGMGLQLQGIAQADKKTRNCLGADTSVGGYI